MSYNQIQELKECNFHELKTFFDSEEDVNDFYEKLHNKNRVLVLLGPGCNGKTTLCHQLAIMSPPKYYGFPQYGDDFDDYKNAKKVIYCSNDVGDIKSIESYGLSYDVVNMYKDFSH
jgi:ABC-type cobalamin/Fe3+-siderophores transport system ATPase subunit